MDQPPKKFSELYILSILMRYTDSEHTMTKQQIKARLLKDYGLELKDNAIRRNLDWLVMDEESNVCCNDQKKRVVIRKGEKKEVAVCTDYYYQQKFETGELRFLVDSALYSAHITPRQRKDLIKKISSCGNERFSSAINHTIYAPKNKSVNRIFFTIIGELHNAISDGRQVTFQYLKYDTDLKQHPRTDKNGKPKQYQVSPYHLVMLNGRYYLICNDGVHNDLMNFRIDRIKNLNILSEPVRPIKDITGDNSIDLAGYVQSHLMMWSGEIVHANIRTHKNMLDDIIDSFGLDIHIIEKNDEQITVRIHAGKEDIVRWAVQFAGDAEVVSPANIRNEVVQKLKNALDNYSK